MKVWFRLDPCLSSSSAAARFELSWASSRSWQTNEDISLIEMCAMGFTITLVVACLDISSIKEWYIYNNLKVDPSQPEEKTTRRNNNRDREENQAGGNVELTLRFIWECPWTRLVWDEIEIYPPKNQMSPSDMWDVFFKHRFWKAESLRFMYFFCIVIVLIMFEVL